MIKVNGLSKEYKTKDGVEKALDNVTIEFNKGEKVAILGKSGCGKSTFLNMLSGVDKPTSGKILVDEYDVTRASTTSLRKYRRDTVGFIFQRYNLVDSLTLLENVIMPLVWNGMKKKVAIKEATEVIKKVKLEKFIDKPVKVLSGGQKQRAAIARSVCMNPKFLLADEPTAALDKTTSKEVMDLLFEVSKDKLLILVTHDRELANNYCKRIVEIESGVIISDRGSKISSASHVEVSKNPRNLPRSVGSIFGYSLKSFKTGRKNNNRIILSITIAFTMMYLTLLMFTNMINYNDHFLKINNDERILKYIYDDVDAVIDNEIIMEHGITYEYYTADFYLEGMNPEEMIYIPSLNDVSIASIETIPLYKDNFRLSDDIYVGRYPNEPNEIMVTTEFYAVNFLNISLDSEVNSTLGIVDTDVDFNEHLGSGLNICPTSDYSDQNCYKYSITGFINSNYPSSSYANNVFVSSAGFENYINFVKDDLGYSSFSEYSYMNYMYLTDDEYIDDVLKVFDDENIYYEYSNISDGLERMFVMDAASTMIVIFLIAVAFIAAIMAITIQVMAIEKRKREVGIYDSLGINRMRILSIFVFEFIQMAVKILFITTIILFISLLFFEVTYDSLIIGSTNIENGFGFNLTKDYNISFYGYINIITLAVLFTAMFIPINVILSRKAIEALV